MQKHRILGGLLRHFGLTGHVVSGETNAARARGKSPVERSQRLQTCNRREREREPAGEGEGACSWSRCAGDLFTLYVNRCKKFLDAEQIRHSPQKSGSLKSKPDRRAQMVEYRSITPWMMFTTYKCQITERPCLCKIEACPADASLGRAF